MKTPKIAKAISHIDEELVLGAAEQKNKSARGIWIKCCAAAASFAVIVIGIAAYPNLFDKTDVAPTPSGDIINTEEQYSIISSNGIKRPYKSFSVRTENAAIVWPWEYKAVYEKYPLITLDGREYNCRGREISPSLLGPKLGVGEAKGGDIYENKEYKESFDVYRINGVSEQHLAAVKMEDKYYVFISRQSAPPATLGELFDIYSIPENITLGRFSFEGKDIEDNSYILRNDDYIWSILDGCSAARAQDSVGWHGNRGNYISFTLNSEALGVYKTVMYITEKGYLWTNAFDIGALYFIGEDAAARIIEHARSNSDETEAEPYEYTLVGKITEIGEGYLLLDDSSVCADEKDGMVFKVSTEDIRMRRCIEFEKIGVGATVVLRYNGVILEGNLVPGAYGMDRGFIHDGAVVVPE